MENIKRSMFGYNKKDVHNLIQQKDEIIHRQQNDIDYLRNENNNLNCQLSNNAKKSDAVNRATKLEQDHLDIQKEMQ